MPWPLSQDYNEAIQDCSTTFSDPDLKAGEAVTKSLCYDLCFGSS
jgi:hypothetical protein